MKQQFYKINFFLLYLIIFQKSFSSDWTRKLYKPNLTIKKDKHNAGDNLIIKNIVTSDGKVKLSYSRTSSRMISPINNSSLLEYFFKNEDGALFFCIYKNIASTLGKDKSRCYILQNYFNQFKNKKCCTIYKMAPHETCPSSEFEIFIGFKKINSSECIQALIHSSEGNFSMQAAVALFRKICIENNKNTLSIVINKSFSNL